MFKTLLRLGMLSAVCSLLPAASAAADTIVIGQVAPFSGPQAVTGRAIHAGARLYIDHINAQGGVNGRMLHFVTRDDAQQVTESVRLVRELIEEERPIALIGTVGTSNIEAIIEDGALRETGVALVGAVSGASSVIRGDNVFVIKASYHEEVNALFRNLATVAITQVGMVYQDDGFGHDVVEGARIAAERHGIDLIATAGYERNTLAVEPAVQAMLDAQPQVIFLGATTAAGIEFVRQYREASGDATLYGLSVIDTGQLLNRIGAEVAHGYAFGAVLPLETQRTLGVNRFYLSLRERSTDPDLSTRSVEGFIAAMTLVHALEVASQDGAQPTAQSLLQALRSIRNLDLGDYTVDFSTPGEAGSTHVNFAIIGRGGALIH